MPLKEPEQGLSGTVPAGGKNDCVDSWASSGNAWIQSSAVREPRMLASSGVYPTACEMCSHGACLKAIDVTLFRTVKGDTPWNSTPVIKDTRYVSDTIGMF
jgi:hypothetical protein